MDYFHALLDSYDKLKKRKLRVVLPKISEAEAQTPTNDPNAESLAQQAIQKAQGGSHAKPVDIGQTSTGVPVRGYKSQERAILVIAPWPRGGMRQKQVIDPNGQVIPDVWQEFVGFFKEDGAEDTGDTGVDGQEVTPEEQELAAAQQMAALAEEERLREDLGWGGTNGIETSARKLAEKGFTDKTKELLERLVPFATKSINSFMTYIVGESGQSLERKIRNAQGINIYEDENGNQVFELAPMSTETKRTTTRKLKDAFNRLEKGSCKEEDKTFFESNFRKAKIGGGAALLVRGDMDGDGLVVDKTTASVLTSLIEGQCDNVSVPTMTRDISQELPGDSSKRGFSFENIMESLVYQANCISARNRANAQGCEGVEELGNCNEATEEGDDCAELVANTNAMCQAGKEATCEFLSDLEVFMRIHGWTKAYSGDNWPTALAEGAAELVDAYNSTIGDPEGLKNIVEGMAIMTRKTLEIRQPRMVFRIGQMTEDGDKADNLEVWTSREEAEAGLAAQGYEPDEIARLVQEQTIGEALVGMDATLQRAINSRAVGSADQVVFTAGLSLKNLLKKRAEHAGERDDRILSDVIRNPNTDPKRMEFTRTIERRLGLGLADRAEIQEYQERLDRITEAVGRLAPSVNFLDSDGKLQQAEPLREAVKSVLDSLKTDNNVETLLDGETAEGELYSLLDSISDAKTKDIPEERVKEVLVRYFTGKRLNKDVEEEQRTGTVGSATKHLAMSTALVATSTRDIMAEVRTLDDLNVCNYMHNDTVNQGLLGLLAGDGSWVAQSTREGMGIVISNSGDSSQSIRTSKEGTKQGESRITKTHVNMSTGLIESSCRSGQAQALNNSIEINKLAERLVEDQVNLIKLIIQGNNSHATPSKFQA